MDYRIFGTTMQGLHFNLRRGETLYSETGSLLYMSPGVELQTAATGGIGGAFRRMMTGNSFFLNYFRSHADDSSLAFTTRLPGHILPLQIAPHQGIFVQRHSFLCAEESVQLDMVSNFSGFGFFGGNGIIYNHLYGSGQAFISIDGEVVEKELGYGENLLIHAHHLCAYQESVRVDLKPVQGFRNLFFGGDGIFLIQVSGPGKVWIHTLSMANLAEAMVPYLPNR